MTLQRLVYLITYTVYDVRIGKYKPITIHMYKTVITGFSYIVYIVGTYGKVYNYFCNFQRILD